MELTKDIIATARNRGADVAGIAGMTDLRSSPSHLLYPKIGEYEGKCAPESDVLPAAELFDWPDTAESVLVIGLSHPSNQPYLDWMDGKNTPGNRLLIDILKNTAEQLETHLHIRTHNLHYLVEKGGAFLKDAASLAGLGCIGRNNLFITPRFGPRIRLRALLLDTHCPSTGPLQFDPCRTCTTDCRSVCPQESMKEKAPYLDGVCETRILPARDGFYNRQRCDRQMEKNTIRSRQKGGISSVYPIKYCRKCEFVCPVGTPASPSEDNLDSEPE